VAGSGDAEIARLPTVVSEASKSGSSAAHGKISRKDSFWKIID
jgi:hypothetical protein